MSTWELAPEQSEVVQSLFSSTMKLLSKLSKVDEGGNTSDGSFKIVASGTL